MVKVYILFLLVILRAAVPERKIELKDILILFDRESGISIFPNLRGYDDPVSDVEWVLERNPSSKGFILRPIVCDGRYGLWIGEFTGYGNEVTRHEETYDREASRISRLIMKYSSHEITERKLIEMLSIDALKRRLKSDIIRGFKYYTCPRERFYQSCGEVGRIYRELKGRYGKGRRISYSSIADEIAEMVRCEDVVVCPLKAPNAFERIHNFDRALKSRGIGGIKFVKPGIIEIL